jgi:hypothetical protein
MKQALHNLFVTALAFSFSRLFENNDGEKTISTRIPNTMSWETIRCSYDCVHPFIPRPGWSYE